MQRLHAGNICGNVQEWQQTWACTCRTKPESSYAATLVCSVYMSQKPLDFGIPLRQLVLQNGISMLLNRNFSL